MASMQVKDIGSLMGGSAASGIGKTVPSQTSGSVSFESVWNNQTDKNSSSQTAAVQQKNTRKNEDVDVRDSLKMKENRNSVVNERGLADEDTELDIEKLSPEEWERAMEVLSTAAAELIQQIADTFNMTVEEVQGLMADLGMEQLAVLQQADLGKLLLAAAGAENVTSLLTDEELYLDYQTLMEQANALLEQSSETLQLDAEQLVQIAVQGEEILETEALPVEITVEDEAFTQQDTDTVKTDTPTEGQHLSDNSVRKTPAEEQSGEHTGNQLQEHTDAKHEIAEDKGQSGNLLLQNLKTESFEPQLQQLTQAASGWDTETTDIMRQIMDYIRIQVKPDMSNVEMQLHPENLGTLQIHVSSKGGNITAQFFTQNETVKAALESQMIQLKESFAEQGVKVDAIEVTVQTHQFEQNLEQGRGRSQSEPDKKPRTRRIQLDGALTMEELNAMEEEDQLAAEMLAANGSTVDYTA